MGGVEISCFVCLSYVMFMCLLLGDAYHHQILILCLVYGELWHAKYFTRTPPRGPACIVYLLLCVWASRVARRATPNHTTVVHMFVVCLGLARRATPKHTTVIHMLVVCLAIKQSARDARASRALCLIALARRDRFKTTIHHTMCVLLEYCVH